MQRRSVLIAAAGAAALTAAGPLAAHHGWSSFNQDQPLYIEGRIKSVQWRNPHAEAVVEVAPALALPADLTRRTMPAQQQGVDGAAVLGKTALPTAAAGEWEVEFAPLSRMEAWGVAPLKIGDRVELIGYAGVAGKPKLMRVEYLMVNGRAYGLRSSPAR
ncbi:MAG: DUF6152 family protein [Burkholderiaceae bacterium]|nr:DUF6152 family protein [Burkholderiaceae bacterium]